MDLLPLNAVHVDLVHTDSADAWGQREAYLALLSPDEHERMTRLVFDRDRRRFLLTRALVRTMLSRYAAVPPERWGFIANVHGRPEILDRPSGVPDLRFNLYELYDLDKDPFELKNLASGRAHAAVRGRLLKELRRLVAEAAAL